MTAAADPATLRFPTMTPTGPGCTARISARTMPQPSGSGAKSSAPGNSTTIPTCGLRWAFESPTCSPAVHLTARRIPDAIRAHVIECDKVCVSCGAPGEEIDHMDGDSNDPGNLQFLCGSCHDAKTSSRMVPATAEQEAIVVELVSTRVTPDTPALLCDDETFWEDAQRKLLRERKARLQDAGAEHDSSDVIRRDIAARSHHRSTPGWLVDNDDFSARGLDDDSGFGEDSYFFRAVHRDD
ncbi:HNH endonuclease [Arthrobacter frigidicola]|nr:HNH endonuclease [Arthrobacter frigidicola]